MKTCAEILWSIGKSYHGLLNSEKIAKIEVLSSKGSPGRIMESRDDL
jgi:hypothetical protein